MATDTPVWLHNPAFLRAVMVISFDEQNQVETLRALDAFLWKPSTPTPWPFSPVETVAGTGHVWRAAALHHAPSSTSVAFSTVLATLPILEQNANGETRNYLKLLRDIEFDEHDAESEARAMAELASLPSLPVVLLVSRAMPAASPFAKVSVMPKMQGRHE